MGPGLGLPRPTHRLGLFDRGLRALPSDIASSTGVSRDLPVDRKAKAKRGSRNKYGRAPVARSRQDFVTPERRNK